MNKTEEFMKPKTTFGDTLKFSPYAWAKLLYMRDRGPTEVAGYGVTGTEDPLLVTDFILIKQECTSVTFDLDPNDAIEHMDKMMDKGVPAWACSNILIHTHPGDSPSPSGVDEANFSAAFSHPNWAMMFIIAEGGKCYCRLKINIGPGLIKELNVGVEWSNSFGGTDKKSWNEEYKSKVKELSHSFKMTGKEGKGGGNASSFPCYDQGTYFKGQGDPLWFDEESSDWERLSEAEAKELDRDSQVSNQTFKDVDFDCFWNASGNVALWDETKGLWYEYDPLEDQWYEESEDQTEEFLLPIDSPKTDWSLRVEWWADEFADERLLTLEN